MAHVILVHGMYANERSWFDVPAALRDAGHTVNAIRLEGHTTGLVGGTNLEAGAAVEDEASSGVTMDDYVRQIENALPAGEKCTLVGHSFGGMVITHAAANLHDRIERLVYVAAMLPRDDESANDIIGRTGTGLEGILSTFMKHVLSGKLDRNALSKEPKTPHGAKFQHNAGVDSLPVSYIRCDNDAILPTPLQDEMIADANPEEVISLSSDHLPQLSVKKELNEALLKILS